MRIKKHSLKYTLLAGTAFMALGFSSVSFAQEATDTPSANQDGTATLQTFTVDDDAGVALEINTDVDFTIAHDVTATDAGDTGPDTGVVLITGNGAGTETNLGLTIDAGVTVATSVDNSGAVVYSTNADMNIAGGITVNGVINAAGGGAAIDISDANRDSATVVTINGDGGGVNGDVTGNILLGNNAGATDSLVINDDALVTGDVIGGNGNQSLSFTGTGNAQITGDVDLGGNADSIVANRTLSSDLSTIGGNVTNVEDIDVQSGTLVFGGVVDNTNSEITIFDDAILRVGAAGDIQVDVSAETGQSGSQTIQVQNGGTLGAAGTTINLGDGDDSFLLDGATIDADTIDAGLGDDTMTVISNNTIISSDSISGIENINIGLNGVLTIGTGGATTLNDTPTIVLTDNGAGIVFNTTVLITDNVTATSGTSLAQSFTLTSGTYEGNVSLGDGADTVTLTAGRIGALDGSNVVGLGSGADVFNLNGGDVYSSITGGAGDIIEVGGNATIHNNVSSGIIIQIANGTELTIDADGKTVSTNVNEDGLNEDQTLIVEAGTLVGDINFGGGTNVFTLNSGAFEGDYTGGNGDDTLTVTLATADTAQTFENVDLGAGGTDVFTINQGDITISGTFNGPFADMNFAANDTSLLLTADADVTTDNFTIGTGADLTFVLRDTTNYGDINAASDAVVTDNEIIINVDGSAIISRDNTDTFDLITSTGGVTDFQTTAITDTSAFVSFTNTSPDADNLQVTAIIREGSELVTGQGDAYLSGVANAILAVPDGSSTRTDRFIGRLLSAESDAEARDLIASIAPTIDGSFIGSTFEVSNQSASIVSTRLASLRQDDGSASTGMVTGEISEGVKLWAQAFASSSEQSEREGIYGYDASAFGMAAGIDTVDPFKPYTLGVGFSYADTSTTSNNINESSNAIDSYILTLYGEYLFDTDVYLNGQVSYGWNEVATTRSNVGGVLDTALGKLNTSQKRVRAEAGKDFFMDNGWVLTPNFMTNYMTINPDNYTEGGVGGLGQNVQYDDMNILEFGVGLDANWEFMTNSGAVQPKLHAGYRYEVFQDAVAATGSFVAGGPEFRIVGAEPAASRYDIGGGLSYFTRNNWEVTFDYSYDFREDYSAHSGFVKAAHKF